MYRMEMMYNLVDPPILFAKIIQRYQIWIGTQTSCDYAIVCNQVGILKVILVFLLGCS